MTDFAKKLKENRKKHSLSQKDLAKKLGLGQTAIANYEAGLRMPSPDKLIEISRLLDVSIQNLLNIEEDSTLSNIDIDTLKERLMHLLLEQKEQEVLELVLKNNYSNLAIVELFEKVIKEILYEVGDLWQKGDVSVAKEHYISNVVLKLINSISAKNELKSIDGGECEIALCMAYCSELHFIGIRMVEEYLKLLGMKTIFIGNNLPIESVIEMIKSSKASIVAISITMSEHLLGAKDLIKKIKYVDGLENVKVIVGGLAFSKAKEEYIKIGADGLANDFNSLYEVLYKLGFVFKKCDVK